LPFSCYIGPAIPGSPGSTATRVKNPFIPPIAEQSRLSLAGGFNTLLQRKKRSSENWGFQSFFQLADRPGIKQKGAGAFLFITSTMYRPCSSFL
jgi:hypothetical protein